MLIERQRHYYKSVSDDAKKSVSVIAIKKKLIQLIMSWIFIFLILCDYNVYKASANFYILFFHRYAMEECGRLPFRHI